VGVSTRGATAEEQIGLAQADASSHQGGKGQEQIGLAQADDSKAARPVVPEVEDSFFDLGLNRELLSTSRLSAGVSVRTSAGGDTSARGSQHVAPESEMADSFLDLGLNR